MTNSSPVAGAGEVQSAPTQQASADAENMVGAALAEHISGSFGFSTPTYEHPGNPHEKWYRPMQLQREDVLVCLTSFNMKDKRVYMTLIGKKGEHCHCVNAKNRLEYPLKEKSLRAIEKSFDALPLYSGNASLENLTLASWHVGKTWTTRLLTRDEAEPIYKCIAEESPW